LFARTDGEWVAGKTFACVEPVRRNCDRIEQLGSQELSARVTVEAERAAPVTEVVPLGSSFVGGILDRCRSRTPIEAL
jgi:hypothetical protein